MKQWKNWFAWYPVAYGPHIVWFTTIQRYYNPEQQVWYYRRTPSPTAVVTRVSKARDIDWVKVLKTFIAKLSK